jgi:prepilin-type processing-associated H-X9-DG protein
MVNDAFRVTIRTTPVQGWCLVAVNGRSVFGNLQFLDGHVEQAQISPGRLRKGISRLCISRL